MLAKWPITGPRNWIDYVNAPQTEAEVLALECSIDRGAPYGTDRWNQRVAKRLGLESSLRPRGRPKKAKK